jgi:hypothetical protein
MATLTHPYKHVPMRTAFIKKRDAFIEKHTPRPCMLVSAGLILAGLSIPLLMVIQVLQPGWLLGLLGFGLTASGGVLMLIFCGEI